MSDQTDDALLDDLTDEEREAMAYDENADQGNNNVDQNADPEAAAADETDPEAVAVDPDAGSAEPAAAAAAEPEAAAAAEPAAQPEPQAAPAPAPILIAQAPEDAQAKLTEIATAKDAVLDQYEAGEITEREKQKQLDALNDQAFDIKQQVRDAELAQKMEAQRQQNEWDRDCRTFLDTHATDYRGDDKADRVQALDMAIKVMAKMPVNQGIAGPALLAKAHAFVKASYGEAVTPAAQQTKPVKQATIPKPEIPPTNVGKLPVADANDTAGGEFAHLDRLSKTDLEAYELAIEKLSDSQRTRYLRA